MFNTVAEWLKQDKNTKPEGNDANELARLVTALMIEAGNADGSLDKAEQTLTIEVIARQFELDEAQAAEMMNAAVDQSAERVELHSLLRRLRDNSDYEERLGVMEMVWMVVLADGKLDHIEAQLMRRLAGLLYVDDVASGHAANSARARLGLEA